MSLLKKIQESNKAGLDLMQKHPMLTGVYGSILLDKVLDHATKPYIYEGKNRDTKKHQLNMRRNY